MATYRQLSGFGQASDTQFTGIGQSETRNKTLKSASDPQ